MKINFLIATTVLWLLVVGGFIASQEMILRGGQEVLLKVSQMDPRDIFRGDYAALHYDISSIDPAAFALTREKIKSGQTVYVGLSVEDGVWHVSSLSIDKPTAGLFIKGRWTWTQQSRSVVEHWTAEQISAARKQSRLWEMVPMGHVDYGIESYFIPEGKGSDPALRDKDLLAKVRISANGNALLSGLWLNGQEVRLSSGR